MTHCSQQDTSDFEKDYGTFKNMGNTTIPKGQYSSSMLLTVSSAACQIINIIFSKIDMKITQASI